MEVVVVTMKMTFCLDVFVETVIYLHPLEAVVVVKENIYLFVCVASPTRKYLEVLQETLSVLCAAVLGLYPTPMEEVEAEVCPYPCLADVVEVP